MLEEFLHKQDIDVALLQEVTNTKISTFKRYTAHINIGTEGRRTAILAKDCYSLTNIHRIPKGRDISATFNGIKISNIYAPSGSEKNREREEFYNDHVIRLFMHSSDKMILAGDFNCVQNPSDCTGSLNKSRTLERLVTDLDLVDVWNTNETRKIYTHYTVKGASRIDRIYLSRPLLERKQGTETIAAAFADHLAVIFRMPLEAPCMM
jgi:exonuclease III